MIRKYLIIVSAIALASLSLASCFRDEPLRNENESLGNGIELTLDAGDMELFTKADDTRPGDEDGAFNENKLAGNAMVFFFAPDADENTPARWNRSCPIGNNPMQIDVTMADLAQLFGSRNPQAGAQATVIVVTNYDGQALDLSSHKYTKKEIKERSLMRADLSQHPQDHFVMLSDETTITLIDPKSLTPAKATVKLRRRMAKVTFRLTIAEEIAVENYAYSTDTQGNITATKSIEIWRPQIDKMTIYSQYFLKDGNLGGEPIKVPVNKESDSLFTGVNNPYTLLETTTMIARQRKVFNLDGEGHYMQDEDGNYITHDETVNVPLFITKYNDGDDDPSNDIDGPFYTYPVTWDPGVETEPFLKLIIPWQSGKDQRVKYYYYKIPFQVEALEANNWYEVTLDVQILGGEEELPVPLEAHYHIVDWVPGPESPTSTVSARYLSVPVKSFTMYNIEDLEIPMISSHPCEIVNISAKKPNYSTNNETWNQVLNNASSATARNQGFEFDVDGLDAIDFHHDINNTMGASLDCTPYTITLRVRQIDKPDDYYADITIIQYPAIYISPRPGGNAFVDGYFGHLSAWPTNFTYRTGIARSIGFSSYNASTGTVTYRSTGNGYQYTPYGRIDYQVATNAITNLTRVTVTAFGEGSGEYTTYRQNGTNNNGPFTEETHQYIIGDPRVPSGWKSSDLVPYLSNMTNANTNTNGVTSTAWGDKASQIMIGTPEPNYIAPSFYIVSYWTRPGNSSDPAITFEMAQKRCATLQEAGLPAGRWRLPTEAEVYFCRQLQLYNHIPSLFTSSGNQGYYSSSGYAYYSVDNQTWRFREWEPYYTGSGGISVRCVYDVWYWGEAAIEDTTIYTPLP